MPGRAVLKGAARLVLVAFLATIGQFPVLSIADSFTMDGRVLTPDGITPVEGVEIVFKDKATGKSYPSTKTDANGRYRLDLPPGDYTIFAKTASGLMELPGGVSLGGGMPTTFSLTLTPQAYDAFLAGQAAGGPASADRRKKAIWIGSIVGAAVLIGFIAANAGDDEDQDGSRSKP